MIEQQKSMSLSERNYGENPTEQETTEKFLRAIKNNPYITTNELAVICNLTPDGIYWNMKKLKTAGLLTRIGPDKGGHWEVTEN